METIKAIAMLCSIVAVDKPSVVENKQVKCHAYYASCLKGKRPEVTSVMDCMSKRHNDGLEAKKIKR